jgi:hypothetical protein
MVIEHKKDNDICHMKSSIWPGTDTEIRRGETGYWDSNSLLLLIKPPTAMLFFFLFKITFVNIFSKTEIIIK